MRVSRSMVRTLPPDVKSYGRRGRSDLARRDREIRQPCRPERKCRGASPYSRPLPSPPVSRLRSPVESRTFVTEAAVIRVVNVVGARPNFMKIAPIVAELARRPDRFEQLLVHTGQHYDEAMSDAFFADLGIPRPD